MGRRQPKVEVEEVQVDPDMQHIPTTPDSTIKTFGDGSPEGSLDSNEMREILWKHFAVRRAIHLEQILLNENVLRKMIKPVDDRSM